MREHIRKFKEMVIQSDSDDDSVPSRPAKKLKPEEDPGCLSLAPYVFQSTGRVVTGIDATARLEDIGKKKGEEPWWYKSFHEEFQY